MLIADEWKRRIVKADALDAVNVENAERVMPPYSRRGVHAVPRALRTPFVETLAEQPERVDPAEVGPRFVQAVRDGGGHDQLPFTGQSAALVHDIRPAAEIVREMVAEAEQALARAAAAVSPPASR